MQPVRVDRVHAAARNRRYAPGRRTKPLPVAAPRPSQLDSPPHGRRANGPMPVARLAALLSLAAVLLVATGVEARTPRLSFATQ